MPPSNTSKVPPGTLLESKYRITKEIGRGGMAAVYEAEHIEIGKRVAVKILAAELVSSRVVLGRFLREARATAAIRSPYICDVYDSGEWSERPFLVMELLEGESLYELLTRERRLSLERTVRIAAQTAKGLVKAHASNVVHRDLKPENIFMARTEEGDTVAKILDFGLAKFYEPANEGGEATRLTREGALFGTPAYMAPEQAKGQGEVDHRCDLWALGCIVYECLTGRTVWNSEQGVAMILAQIAGAQIPVPSRFRPDLPQGFDEWFLKALARDPDERFQTAKEFAQSLEQVANQAPLSVTGLSQPEPASDGSYPDSWDPQLQAAPQFQAPSQHAGASQHGAAPLTFSNLPAEPRELNPSALTPDLSAAHPMQPQPAPRASGAHLGKAIALLLLLGSTAIAGYAVWFYILNPPPPSAGPPPPEMPQVVASAEAAEAPAEDAPSEAQAPLEDAPYAKQIAAAQEQLSEGKYNQSLATFREAFNAGGTRVARGLLNQAGSILKPPEGGRCRLTGLSRPRPYDNATKPSRTSTAITQAGPLFVWVDNHEDPKRRHAFGVLLDSSLRRVSQARSLTPETETTLHPQIFPVGARVALLYSDARGSAPGVYTRLLEQDGRIAGAARRVSSRVRYEYAPTLAQAEDGKFWAVWQENERADLFTRLLDEELKPVGSPVQLTALKVADGKELRRPVADIAQGKLNITFEKSLGSATHIMLLSVALDHPELIRGSTSPGEGEAEAPKPPPEGHLGKLHQVSSRAGKHAEPSIGCTQEGCYLAWDDEAAGAQVAFYDHATEEAIWRREISALGNRPKVASSGAQAAMAWFEVRNKRVLMARIGRDGIEQPSLVGRMSAFQPNPDLVPGEPGEWFISWRDFEAGQLESYLVRARCEEAP